MTPEITIELAGSDDVAALPEIERAAGGLFAGCTLAGAIVGFALVGLIDGQPHLEEMDVHPAFGRRGIGARLLAAVTEWARSAGCDHAHHLSRHSLERAVLRARWVSRAACE